jgi:hypothetical protein
MALTAWDEQRDYLDRVSGIAANGAKVGRSLHWLLSRGAGEMHFIQPIPFQLTFVNKPLFTSGVALATGQLTSGAYPVVSTGVFKWQGDSRGFYIGAWIWIAVGFADTQLGTSSTDAVDATARAAALNKLELEHHLSFEGLALRDINYDQMMADG